MASEASPTTTDDGFTNQGMDELIKLINQLQEGFSQVDQAMALELPMIAVVGSQSAGKSSVLENFVGRDFLPRGSGIVTRRPLILQLVTYSSEYATFGHTGEKQFHDFAEVRAEIQRETDRETGSNLGISSKPICLTVYSPHVLTLTLVDLPGLTKVAVGDQPKDIEQQIRKMIMEYISRKNCLVLAVCPANADIANSDALKLAREVDPETERTFGVLTKLDLMDKGTDARRILENAVYPLRKGYVGVVNRSQKDIDSNKQILAAMAAERAFFTGHPAYRPMAEQMGSAVLQRILNKQLAVHIASQVPQLRVMLERQLDTLTRERAELEEADFSDLGKRMKYVNGMLKQCADFLKQDIEGVSRHVETRALGSGAHIAKVFEKKFPHALKKRESKPEDLKASIRVAIHNIHAYNAGLFTPDKAFEAVCKTEIELIKDPVQKCVIMISRQLQVTIERMAEILNRMPRLRDEIYQRTTTRLAQLEVETKRQLLMFIECQQTYINKNNSEFQAHLRYNPTPLTSTQGKQVQPVTRLVRKEKTAKMASPQPPIDQIIYSGDSIPIQIGKKTKNLSALLSLSPKGPVFAIYEDSGHSKPLLICSASQLGFRTAPTGDRDALCLTRLDGGALLKTEKALFIHANVYDWLQAFTTATDPKQGLNGALENVDTTSVRSLPIEEETEAVLSQEPPPDPLNAEIENVRVMVMAYVRIVHNVIRDTVPKMVIKHFLFELIDYFPINILQDIEQDHGKDMATLLQESEEMTARRQRVYKSYETVQMALSNIRRLSVNSDLLSEVQGQTKGPAYWRSETEDKHKRQTIIEAEYSDSDSDFDN